MSIEGQERETGACTDLASDEQNPAHDYEGQGETLAPIALLALGLLDVAIDPARPALFDLGSNLGFWQRDLSLSYRREMSLRSSSFRSLRSDGRP